VARYRRAQGKDRLDDGSGEHAGNCNETKKRNIGEGSRRDQYDSHAREKEDNPGVVHGASAIEERLVLEKPSRVFATELWLGDVIRCHLGEAQIFARRDVVPTRIECKLNRADEQECSHYEE
jgi:hypothetical protein